MYNYIDNMKHIVPLDITTVAILCIDKYKSFQCYHIVCIRTNN